MGHWFSSRLWLVRGNVSPSRTPAQKPKWSALSSTSLKVGAAKTRSEYHFCCPIARFGRLPFRHRIGRRATRMRSELSRDSYRHFEIYSFFRTRHSAIMSCSTALQQSHVHYFLTRGDCTFPKDSLSTHEWRLGVALRIHCAAVAAS